jgi:small redox-active disulfide protein 2
MKNLIVLGSGCSKCNKTAESISKIAEDLGVSIQLEKDTSPQSLLKYGVMSTPAVVLDGTLVHSGSIPHRESIESWLK